MRYNKCGRSNKHPFYVVIATILEQHMQTKQTGPNIVHSGSAARRACVRPRHGPGRVMLGPGQKSVPRAGQLGLKPNAHLLTEHGVFWECGTRLCPRIYRVVPQVEFYFDLTYPHSFHSSRSPQATASA